jgi:hypothetical protein
VVDAPERKEDMKLHRNLMLAALAVAGLALFAGCDSDSVAPNDNLPAITAEDAANQAGAVAMAWTTIAHLAIDDPGAMAKAATAHPVDGAGFSGEVWIDWRTEEGGADAAWNTAGWVRVFTETGAPVVYTTPLGGETAFVLDVAAAIERDPTTGEINGGGSMVSGDYTLSYGVTGLIVQEGADYPLDGSIGVDTQGHSVMIQFDGDNTAILTVDMSEYWVVNLDTGAVDPLADPT